MSVWAPPAVNQGWWTANTAEGTPGCGIPDGLDRFLAGGAEDRAVTGTVIDVTDAPYNADNTGVSDCKTAVVDALAASSSGDVIYFPAGTYRFDTGFIYLEYKDNITIRGAGVGVTTFVCSIADQPIFQFSSPGSIFDGPRTVSGTKTKGTTTLTVDNTGLSTGRIISVGYQNEDDNTRIIAGAAPVWSSIGSTFARKMTGIVTGTGSGTITIEPPLPADGSNLTVQVGSFPFDWMSEWVGFEDFSVQFDSAQHPSSFLNIGCAKYCWVYNVHFEDWSKTTSNGNCLGLGESYRCEIRKCTFNSETGSSSDGMIQTSQNAGALIIDNIFTGEVDNFIYESGNSCNCVIAYNYTPHQLADFHNAHPSINLFEGNISGTYQSDGYHGSSSHQTFFRNWLSALYPITLNRFKRNYVLCGNIFGTEGVNNPLISWGNPNIGNGAADGFAGPTGLSDQEGQTDYSQPGYGPDEYIIQASDIFEGDFWEDWKVTATLTTRTNDTSGVITVSGGNFFTGASPTGGADLLIAVRWNSGADAMFNGTVTNVAGSAVTVAWGSGTLPAQGTNLTVFFGPAGWQERDLDVQASSTLQENFWAASNGSGAIRNSISPDTLPDSLIFGSKPTFFRSLAWPPFNPSVESTANIDRIPAGYRANHNGDDPPLSGGTTITVANVTNFNIL